MTELRPLSLPTSDDALSWVAQRCDGELERARGLVDELKASPPEGTLAVLQQWNRVQTALRNASSAASVFSEVHPRADVRDAADEAMQRIDAYATGLGLDPELFAVFEDLDADGLDADATRVLDHTLRDFRRSGVDRDDATRARLAELADEELRAGQDFSKNIRDGVRRIRVRPEQLEGLPEDWRGQRPAGDDGLVEITTDYPDSVPVRTFCHDADVRREVAQAALLVGWPENDAVLQRLFALRAEHASLLGYDTWADYVSETKMIGTGSAIGEFIDKITDLTTDSARRDVDVLLERARQDHPGLERLSTADVGYYGEVVRREQHEVDAQQVRRYFLFEQVRQGMLDVTGRLFGLTWAPAGDASPWHEDVATYDVLRDGERVGRIHLDLHPRDGKFKHAAQFDVVPGVLGVQLPEGALVCNLTKGLMEHDEVVTLFHEFGHLVHHVLGGAQEWVEFSGVATEWDFVEAPSQMLEEWAWDEHVLATFARDAEGRAIPADLVRRMRTADDFGKGYQARTQMFYAAISLDLHSHHYDDLTARVRELQPEYSLFEPLPESHMHCSFGHLHGYGPSYYTYMWSLVIAKDLFSAFDADDLFAGDVATRYRDRVLAQGGRKDAADLVEDFLGRPYTFDAYAAWLAE